MYVVLTLLCVIVSVPKAGSSFYLCYVFTFLRFSERSDKDHASACLSSNVVACHYTLTASPLCTHTYDNAGKKALLHVG